MAIRTRTEQLDTMYTTTWVARKKEIIDQVFKAVPLFLLMDRRGHRKQQRGGRNIEIPLRIGKNTSVQFIGRGDSVTFVDDDNLSVANYDWGYLTGHILRYFQDFQQNRGSAELKNKVNEDIDNLRDSSIDRLESAMFGDGSGDDGKAIDGLQSLVPTDPSTGTVGGINRANYSWWRNNYYDMDGEEVTVLLTDRMTTMFNDCGVYGMGVSRFPDLIVTDQTTYESYERECRELGQIALTADQQMADLGFGELLFKGRHITWSPSCPSGYMWFLNSHYLYWTVDPIENLNLGEWLSIPNQPRDRIAHLMTVGNLGASNSRKQGVIFNIGS